MGAVSYNQYKFNYYRKVNRQLMTIFTVLNLIYILSDMYMYGGFHYIFILCRCMVVPFYIGYLIFDKMNIRYTYLTALTYLFMHLIYTSTACSLHFIENRTYASSVLLTYNIAYLALGICHPLRVNTFFHILYIVNILIIQHIFKTPSFIDLFVINLPAFALIELFAQITDTLFHKHMKLELSLKKAAFVDNLTNVYNRGIFKQITDRDNVLLMDGATILMLDIDFFKAINDTYGHDEGDKVLQEFASILVQNVRGSDYVIRWGGEEFIVILQKCPLDKAINIAERIRVTVEGNKNCKCCFTVSIGISEYRGEDYNKAIKLADKALYKAKHNGRNKISVAERD